jgi:fibronectin type 3 domain-containing protein
MAQAEINQLMAAMKAQNVTVVEADFQEGLSRYRTEEEFDEFLAPMTRLAAGAHANDLKVVVYYASLEVLTPNGANPEVKSMFEEHPDWVQMGWGDPHGDGTGIVDPKPNVFRGGDPYTPHWIEEGMEDAWMSPSSAYRDYYYARLKRMAGTGIDGIWVDVPLYSDWGANTWNDISDAAKARFTADTGLVAPTEEGWDSDDLTWRRWIAWRHGELTRFIADAALAVRTNPDRPDFVIVVETLPTDYAGATVWGLEGADLRSIEGVISVWEVSTLSINTGMRKAREDDWISYISVQKYIKAASGTKPAWSFAYGKQADDAELLAGEILSSRNNVYEVKQPDMTATVAPAYRTNLFGWIKSNESYLSNTAPAARVALLYSLASRDYVDKFEGLGQFATTTDGGDDSWWSNAPSESAYERQYVAEFRGMVKLLVHNHIPFEVVVNPASAAELAKYQTVIMPDWEAASNAEVNIIKAYVDNGGHIIVTGPNPSGWNAVGSYRNEYALSAYLGIDKVALPPPVVPGIQRIQSHGSGEARYFSDLLGKKYFTNAIDAPAAAASLLEAINFTSTPWLITNADKKVHMELTQVANKLILHHVNFIGVDGTLSVPNTSVTTTLKIPEGKEVAAVELTSPDNATHALAPLAYTKTGQGVTFTVPLKKYSVVVVSLADFVTDASSLNVLEGGTASFNVKLSLQPSSDVVVTVARTSGDAGISVSSGASLTFTPSNWDSYQEVTVAAAENADAANKSAAITCSADGLVSRIITATEINNDFSLTVTNDGNGTTAPPSCIVQKDVAINIAATASDEADYPFVNWMVSGDATFANANSAITTVTLKGNATVTAIFRKAIANGTAITAISGNAGSRREYKITVPVTVPAQALLEVKGYGGTGDCDITISKDATVLKYASGATNNEALQIENPVGDYIVSLNAKTDYSGLTLLAKCFNATPAPPTKVAASKGAYHDSILVTWKASAGATGYLIYRSESNNIPADPIAETADTSFIDIFNLAAGKIYNYWIKAKNGTVPGLSAQSAKASGSISNAPVAPTSVTASDGTYFDKIRVTWPKVAGATSYMVFRTVAATTVPDDTNLIGKTTALFFDDFGDDIAPHNKYYYWIKAKNNGATTATSRSNEGCLSSKGPAKVTASTTYADRIVVTWAAVPGATSYDVYRDTVSKFTENMVKVGNAVEALTCKDAPLVVGTYYYRVKAKYGSYESDFSSTASTGKVGLSAHPDATPLVNGTVSELSGIRGKGSCLYFSMEVPIDTSRLVATLDGTTNALENDCNLFAKFANVPTSSSYNAKGVENKDNETLSVSNPSPGTWYFLLYGATEYDNVTLTVNCYSVTDIVLSQVPSNGMTVPFTASFKGQVVDETGKTGIAGLSIQVRNPVTGATVWLPAKTDARGFFTYSTVINSGGEYTFDFFFTGMPDTAKGTASHTVWTQKGCLLADPGSFFDSSAYLPATPVPLVQNDRLGLQDFLSTRNGWDEDAIDPTSETMWVNNTLAKAKDDVKLLGKLDDGLYMFFYGVEGAGVGNDLTVTSALSAVPFVVHVASDKQENVIANLTDLGLIDPLVAANITSGGVGVVAITAVNNPDENPLTGLYDISLFADQQLELLADVAGKSGTSGITVVNNLDVQAKQATITLASGKKINVIVSSFSK